MADMDPIPRPEGKVENLPKWAQRYIKLLNQRLDEAHSHIGVMNHAEPGDTFRHSYTLGDQSLGIRPQIDFYVDDIPSADRRSAPKFEVQRQGDGLYIRGSHGLRIQPLVSNAIHITVSLED